MIMNIRRYITTDVCIRTSLLVFSLLRIDCCRDYDSGQYELIRILALS